MNDQQERDWRRWIDSEHAGHDDDADRLFSNVFRAAARPDLPSSGFTAATLAAVAAAAEADARRARRMRTIGVPVAIAAAAVLVYTTGGLMVSAFSAVVVGALGLLLTLVAGTVSTVATISDGGGVWSIATSLGRAFAGVLASPTVTTTILALQGIAVAALIALQRLLRSDRESFR